MTSVVYILSADSEIDYATLTTVFYRHLHHLLPVDRHDTCHCSFAANAVWVTCKFDKCVNLRASFHDKKVSIVLSIGHSVITRNGRYNRNVYVRLYSFLISDKTQHI